jgi:hypothetical protein
MSGNDSSCVCASEKSSAVEYRQVVGASPNYRVGSDGTIWSRVTGEWKQMKPYKAPKGGHLFIAITIDGKRRHKFVHAIVLEAFAGTRPAGMQACHYPDKNPSNNTTGNLRWDTAQENQKDMYRDRLLKKRKLCQKCKAEKPFTDYHANKRLPDGRQVYCKACVLAAHKLENSTCITDSMRRVVADLVNGNLSITGGVAVVLKALRRRGLVDESNRLTACGQKLIELKEPT